MGETSAKTTKNDAIIFAKKLGWKFSMNAAASAGITFGVMAVLRIVLPNSAVQTATVNTSSTK